MSVSVAQQYIFAAMFLAGFTAAYKFQFQSLFFLLAVCFGQVSSWGTFTMFAIFHIAVCMFSGFLNGTLSVSRD